MEQETVLNRGPKELQTASLMPDVLLSTLTTDHLEHV